MDYTLANRDDLPLDANIYDFEGRNTHVPRKFVNSGKLN